ncbi:MAG TPA: hypothetical protein DDW65_10455 [Firmicutes bacterium]|jgi:hypothetical protein|nr:hypothetical protein [Bacillota bacterium]
MRLADQARMGQIVIGALVVVLLIPFLVNFVTLPQTLTIEGTYIRDNSRAFPRFLEGIKAHHGVLILGTSETGNHLSGENYWAMLNRDQTVKPYFSVLGGAGRCSYIWFPPILANQKSFKGLSVLYYLNPTYWREDLNGFARSYYERYNGFLLVRQILPEAKRQGIESLVTPYFGGHHELRACTEDWREWVLDQFENCNSFYSYDLRNLVKGGFAPKSADFRQPAAAELWMWQYGLNLDHNVSEEYYQQNPATGIPAVGNSDFQYRALKAFIELSKRVGIHLVVFVGPYNGILARSNSPQVVPAYETTIHNIKRILVESRTEFIDGTDLSYGQGVFRDVQHNSTFGAWKIEQKIAAYYNR